jgi:multimeric flavodoxin WrbA
VLAGGFCGEATRLGAVVERFTLNTLRFRGCQGCESCKTRLDRCALDDDLTPVLESVRGADVVVLASPIYYGDVSSQLKAFIDRTYSFVVPDYRTNPKPHRFASSKELVFIQTQSNPDERLFADVLDRYGVFFGAMGFAKRHLIRACGVHQLGDVEKRADVLNLACATAVQVCRAAGSNQAGT